MAFSISPIVTIFLALAQVSLAAPEPAITAAAIFPRKVAKQDKRHDDSIRAVIALRNLSSRTSDPGLGVCYGFGAICDLYLDLSCPFNLDNDDWYKCLCETGYISTKAACENCDTFYGLGGTNDGDSWSKSCSSMGLSIAPIPSKIKSSWAAFNATMTYDTAQSAGGSKTGESSATKTFDDSSDSTSSVSRSPLESGDSASKSSSKTPAPYVLGTRTFVDYTITMAGQPAVPPPTVTPTGLPPLSVGGQAAKESGAEKQTRRTLNVLVVGAIGFTIVCGLIL